ncbi:hypothetical protein B0A55_10686, partial [Friedmanniomyces simplex]
MQDTPPDGALELSFERQADIFIAPLQNKKERGQLTGYTLSFYVSLGIVDHE